MVVLRLLILFLCFATLCFSGISRAAGNETDRLALLAMKSEIKQDPYGILQSWNASDIHFCQWRGVTCGRLHQRITVLNLGSAKLTGSISPFVGNLSFLKRLYLQNNSFDNVIPPQITNLKRIQLLWFQNNSLVGHIPTNLSACSSSLLNFDVSKNMLDGRIPPDLGLLARLEHLFIDYNELVGEIPSSLGNLSSLVTLFLTSNKLTGRIPSTLGMLSNLVYFALAENMLSGTIPSDIFNLSNMAAFDVQFNQFQGILPSHLGNTLTKLNFLGFGHNQFTGSIPISLSNASELTAIFATANSLTGDIPGFGNSGKLSQLLLAGNQLGHGGKFNDLGFFSSLINCTDLRIMSLGLNNLGGKWPLSFLNLSTTLSRFILYNNHITGSIPSGIGKFVNLFEFDISTNSFFGTIPPEIGELQNLQVLYLDHNHLSGNIPLTLGNLSRLISVTLANNQLHGNIPSSLGNCKYVQEISLSHNNLSGPVPLQIFGLSSLSLVLDLSSNHLTGSLPIEVGQLKALDALYVSDNLLSGEIPTSLGSCIGLEYLKLQGNFFLGKIPSSLSALRGLQSLNLAQNSLSGPIPDFLGEFKLKYLNLSFNDFEGEVPNKGIFMNASAVFVNGNKRLCGGVSELELPVCISRESKKESRASTNKLLVPMILGFLGLALMFFLLLFCSLKRRRRPQQTLESSSDDLHFRVSYQTLVAATDGFSSANMIGSGGFGSVYRGNIDNRMLVAVKVLDLEHRAATRSFIAECEAFRNIRHRNLVKLMTVCSGIDYQGNDFKALVYELMVNGNLDEWLHPVPPTGNENHDQQRHCLTLSERLNIVIDVASALDYLHNDCEPPIVHCDMKPSNILLDNDMTAHVGDFGLARFIIKSNNNEETQTSSSVGVIGTTGYTPPEYGLGSEMSTSGDVYSFGILLLEMMTGKRPTDSMFDEGHNLHQFVKNALPNTVTNILEDVLLQDDNNECVISAVKIGVACSSDSPKDRMSTSDVLRQLQILRDSL